MVRMTLVGNPISRCSCVKYNSKALAQADCLNVLRQIAVFIETRASYSKISILQAVQYIT